jgi:hypothetical protein
MKRSKKTLVERIADFRAATAVVNASPEGSKAEGDAYGVRYGLWDSVLRRRAGTLDELIAQSALFWDEFMSHMDELKNYPDVYRFLNALPDVLRKIKADGERLAARPRRRKRAAVVQFRKAA